MRYQLPGSPPFKVLQDGTVREVDHDGLFTPQSYAEELELAACSTTPGFAISPYSYPGEAGSFTAGQASETTQQLAWSDPIPLMPLYPGDVPPAENVALRHFTVAYRLSGQNLGFTTFATRFYGNAITVTGLSPGAAYDYQLTPSNNSPTSAPNNGPASTITNLRTA